MALLLLRRRLLLRVPLPRASLGGLGPLLPLLLPLPLGERGVGGPYLGNLALLWRRMRRGMRRRRSMGRRAGTMTGMRRGGMGGRRMGGVRRS